MGTLQQDLVEAGSTATGERLLLLIFFLHKNGFYDILDLVRARDVELMPGFDDLGLVEASFVKYLWSFVNENGFVPGVVVVPEVVMAARARTWWLRRESVLRKCCRHRLDIQVRSRTWARARL